MFLCKVQILMCPNNEFPCSPSVERDMPRSIQSVHHLSICGCLSVEINFCRFRNGGDIHKLAWQVGAPRNVIGVVGTKVGLGLRLSWYTSDWNDVGGIIRVTGTEADELISCPRQCGSTELLRSSSVSLPPLPSLKPVQSIKNEPS